MFLARRRKWATQQECHWAHHNQTSDQCHWFRDKYQLVCQVITTYTLEYVIYLIDLLEFYQLKLNCLHTEFLWLSLSPQLRCTTHIWTYYLIFGLITSQCKAVLIISFGTRWTITDHDPTFRTFTYLIYKSLKPHNVLCHLIQAHKRQQEKQARVVTYS